MKTRANFYIIVIILIISTLSCKKEEIVAPEKLFIGKWKVTNLATYEKDINTPKYLLTQLNELQEFTIDITESKFYVIDNTLNNKIVNETIYVFRGGTVWGGLNPSAYTTRNFLGLDGEGVKVTFEGNNKMLIRAYLRTKYIFEFTYSRIQ